MVQLDGQKMPDRRRQQKSFMSIRSTHEAQADLIPQWHQGLFDMPEFNYNDSFTVFQGIKTPSAIES